MKRTPVRVRFYELSRDGTATVGDLYIDDQGRLIADPPDRRALARLITEPFQLWHPQKGDLGTILPREHPEEFLKACVREIRGTYFWCKQLPESTGTIIQSR
ncbi:MAG: hypothetical protein HZB34_07795 [Nitrospirae bacterium]|nr:hypothetical protein [Nitrospirota bacterium]